MASYTSADLLALFNDLAGRPASGDAISDANKYKRLARAQVAVMADFAARLPDHLYSHVAYGSTPTLSTTDNQVFTFGTDGNGDASFPIGKANIYTSLSAIPDNPLVAGVDYLWEGTQIRIPNNNTYAGTLYWRGVAPATALDGTTQPTLSPPPARILIVQEAVRSFAVEGNRNAELANQMAAEYGIGLARWCLTLKTAVFTKGRGLGPLTGLRLAEAGY